jgi:hypothetical protein
VIPDPITSLFIPADFSSFPRNLCSALWRHLGRPRLAAFEAAAPAEAHRSRVFSIQGGFWLAVLDLAAGDIYHELGELGRIARALAAIFWHGVNMRQYSSGF